MASALPQAEPVRHVLLSPADTAQQTRRGGMRPGPGRPVTCERPRACSCPSWKQRGQSSCNPHGSACCPFGPLSRPKGSGSERAGQAARTAFLSGTLCSGALGCFQLTYPDLPPWLCGEGVTPFTDGKVGAQGVPVCTVSWGQFASASADSHRETVVWGSRAPAFLFFRHLSGTW